MINIKQLPPLPPENERWIPLQKEPFQKEKMVFQSHLFFRGYANFLRSNAWQKLGGGFNPVEKYARQFGSFPQVGVKIKDNHNITT